MKEVVKESKVEREGEKNKKKERHARIELAGYQARVQQFTIENPVIPRDGAPLMPLKHSTFYSKYIPISI